MPARDIYHDVVVQALIADGWTITDDPLRIAFGARDFYVDLAAELPIGAERDGQRIAVEVKSFIGASNIRDLELAIGQFTLYREVLARSDPARRLYLAVSITRRVHHVAVHVELRGDKVWLQCDNTDLVVAEDLVAAGIPNNAIVLGFRPVEVRKYTDYAVG